MAILSTLKVQYYISRNLCPQECVWVWFGQISLTTSEVSSYFDSHFTPLRLVHRNLDDSSFFPPQLSPAHFKQVRKASTKTQIQREIKAVLSVGGLFVSSSTSLPQSHVGLLNSIFCMMHCQLNMNIETQHRTHENSQSTVVCVYEA